MLKNAKKFIENRIVYYENEVKDSSSMEGHAYKHYEKLRLKRIEKEQVLLELQKELDILESFTSVTL